MIGAALVATSLRVRSSLRDSAWLALLVVSLLHGPLAAVARGETRHVLVLSSSERPFAPQSGFADALVRDLIRSSLEPIRIVEVSVHAARASDETPDSSIAERIRAAPGAGRLDLILTIGGPAATFAQRFRHELFPATPMLMAGVDRRFVETGKLTGNETSVTTQHDPALMIDEILRLLPETRTVLVVVGSSPVEQFWLQEMQREFSRFGSRLQFIWANELSYNEILDRCATMPAQSAIFFAILSRDGKGEPRVEGDTLASLHAVANAPMFALYGMGRGIVGGPLLSTDELSRTTAQVALRILAGEAPSSIQTPIQRSGQPTYDARQLRRWNIDEARLPVSSVVLFREPAIWRRPIAIGALLGGIPILVIGLVVAVMMRRRARSRTIAKDVLAEKLADGVSVWTAAADGTRVAAGHASGAEPRDAWMGVVHPDDVERCRGIYRRALEQRESFQMEYRVREPGGEERWILDTGLPRFSGKGFDGFVGSAVDITGPGRAREELSNLSRHLMQAHDRERAALARTLHEDVCQRIVALTLRLHNLETAAPGGEISDIRDTLASLVSEIAAMSDPLDQRLQLLGLAATCRGICRKLSARYGVAIRFRDDNVPRELPSEIGLALLRVLQEAAVNAVVHSGAREVRVALCATATEVRLQILDRGVGFDTERTSAGIGLVAIRERLKLVKGDCAIDSRAGEGTRVEAWIPLAAARPQ